MKNTPYIEEEILLKLPQTGSWPAVAHVLDAKSDLAIRVAVAAQRPLLVRGEPGTGKSQLARAAAFQLERTLIPEVMHAHSESQDLQYHFDAVARLAEAQVSGSQKEGSIAEQLAPQRFLSPGPLWWAFDWHSAAKQYQLCAHHNRAKPQRLDAQQACVVLIDEIDKAPGELPNALLETLGNGAFSIPYHQHSIGLKAEQTPPLVIITTNEERELPEAFIRRCLVLHLALPKEHADFVPWLVKRGEIHFDGQCQEAILTEAAEMVWQDRQVNQSLGFKGPGQAEYLDLIRALVRLAQNAEQQRAYLEKIRPYVLQKHKGIE